jgi:outer membrane protein assembly factor BamE
LLLAGGCASWLPSFYTIDVRQGNYLDNALVARLRPGMSKTQVQTLLGTPLVTDPFHTNRWDYVYLYEHDGDMQERRRLSLFFNGELLSRFQWLDQMTP